VNSLKVSEAKITHEVFNQPPPLEDYNPFDADLPHHFENEGTDPTRFIAVIAAGLRRS